MKISTAVLSFKSITASSSDFRISNILYNIMVFHILIYKSQESVLGCSLTFSTCPTIDKYRNLFILQNSCGLFISVEITVNDC